MHQFGTARRWREAAAAQGTGARRRLVQRRSACRITAKSPCTRTGRRGGQQSSSPDASLRQAGQRRSGRQGKQDNGTTDAHRCTPMGRSPACSFGAKPNRQCLVSKAVALVRPHPCASVCICGSIFLLPCRVSHFPACLAACRTLPQALSDRDARQDPMHLRDCPTGAARRLTQRATRRWRDSPETGPADISIDE